MDTTIIAGIMMLLTSLGAFMIGFKLLSENVEKLSSKGLKKLFAKSSNNKLVGVGIGAVTTTIVQSSSITTVMMVGFVNAGLMSLLQATALIMGANIGSTTTGLLAALGASSSSAIGIVEVAMLLTPIGIFMNILSKKDKVKTVGCLLAGLGLLLFGISSMSDAMSALKESEDVQNLLKVVKNPFLLLIIGAVLTAVIQSSGAVTAIVVTLAASNAIVGNGGNSMLFIILGTNIGTCSTALLSSIGASTNAKRTSVIHLLFNCFGSVVFFIFLMLYPGFKDEVLSLIPDPALQIAIFHLLFNTICTILFLPFANVFVKLSQKLVKDKEEVDESKVMYLDERIIVVPSIAITQLEKEIARLGDLSMKSLKTSFNAFIDKNKDAKEQIFKEINVVQTLNDEITNYIVKVSANDISLQDEQTLSSLHHTISDILRISEVSDNLVKYTARYVDEELVFSENVINSLVNMYQDVVKLYDVSIKAFVEKDLSLLKQVDEIEEVIDTTRTKLINDHIKRLNEGRCKPENSGVFINLVSNLERIGDHICYVAHSIETQN